MTQPFSPWGAMPLPGQPVSSEDQFMGFMQAQRPELFAQPPAPPPVPRETVSTKTETRTKTAGPMPGGGLADLVAELNKKELDSLKQAGLTVEKLQKKLEGLEGAPLPMDLTGLAALTDAWTGSNFVGAYKPQETQKDRQAAIEKLQAQVVQGQGGLAENEIGLLRTRLNNQFQLENLQSTEAQRKEENALARERLGLERAKLAQGGKDYTPFEKKTDEEGAKELSEFNTAGGFAAAEKNMAAIDEAIRLLENDKEGRLTGVDVGVAAKLGGLSLTNPDAAALQQKIDQVSQGDVKLTLGAQFTQKEGEGVIKRSYDPSLGRDHNLGKLRELKQKMEANYGAKKSATEYARQYGTLKDYQGGVGAAPKAAAPAANEVERQTADGKTAVFDANTKKFLRYK